MILPSAIQAAGELVAVLAGRSLRRLGTSDLTPGSDLVAAGSPAPKT